MVASYDVMATIASQTAFLRRVKYAMKKAAIAIMAEAAITPNHTERVAYVKTVLDGTASVSEYAEAVVTDSTLTAKGSLSDTPTFGILDTDLESSVNSMINAMSGVAL